MGVVAYRYRLRDHKSGRPSTRQLRAELAPSVASGRETGDTARVLGPRFRAHVQAALASGALVLSGCFSDGGLAATESTGDDATGEATETGPPSGPPELLAVERVDTALVLKFSEPVEVPEEIDPEQFRLSAAIFHPGEVKTVYYDPGPWNIYCYVDMDGVEYCYPEQLTAFEVFAGDKPEEVVVEFFIEVYAPTCIALEERATAIDSTGALYLHYSDNGPPIVDLDGEPLVAIGEPWVVDQFSTELAVPGEFPFMNPRLPIPCPVP